MANAGTTEASQRGGIFPSSRLERAIMIAAIAIASIGMGYLFFTQLWWKAPPDFRCNQNFTAGGLCKWVNMEVKHADENRRLFTADIVRSTPKPEVSIPVGWATSLNGVFIKNVVQPNISWFGYILWSTEAFIFLSLVLGFLSRLGALAALGVSTQLMLGLAGTPNEWEWSYQLMVLLSIVLLGLAPGRYFGLDRLLRPRLAALSERGSRLSRVFLAFT